jgi:hypothetical protein
MVVLRLHKEVKWATLKLTSVATDITDPARATPGGFIGGEDGTAALAEFAHGWMRLKRMAREQAPTSRARAPSLHACTAPAPSWLFDVLFEDLEG